MFPYITHNSLPIGPLTIHLFGVLVATGILLGARWTHMRAKVLGLDALKVSSMITTVLVVGFEFSHIFDVFVYKTKGPNPTFLQIINPFEGLSSYGGFIGALMGLFGWCIYKREKIMPYADSLAYGLSLGWMFGRLGCYSAHDHPGGFTDFWLSVPYPDGRRHDLGLDEAIWAGAVALLFWVLARKNRPLGLYVTLLTGLYAPVRFFLDYLRATDVTGADPRYWGFTPAQYASIVVVFISGGLLVWTLNNARKSA